MSDPAPLYCALTPEEQRARRSQVRTTLIPQVLNVTSLTDGVRLEFGPSRELRDLVEEFIVLEQSCCSFLTFTLSTPTNALSLSIQGPPDAAQVIEMFRRTAEGGVQ